MKRDNLVKIAAYFVLFLLMVVTYSSVISTYFIHDDFVQIANWRSMDLGQAFNGSCDGRSYRPLFWLNYRFLYKIFSVDYRLYHYYSLFLHFLNVILVLAISKLLFKKSSAIRHIFTAAIFCVNPILPETTVYYSTHYFLLGTIFIFSGLLFYILFKTRSKRKSIYYFLVMLFFILGLLSNEIVLIFPLILVATDIFLLKQQDKTLNRFKEYLFTYSALAIICIFYLLKRISILGSFWGDWSAYEKAKLTLPNFVNSLRILVVPLNDEIYTHNFILKANIIFFLLLGAILLLRLSKIRFNRNDFYWGVSLFLLSLPVNFLKIKTSWASLIGGRFWYFPAACFSFLLGDLFWGYLDNYRNRIIRNCVYVIAISLLIFYTYAVQKNVSVWREAGAITYNIQQKLLSILRDKEYVVIKSIPGIRKGAYVFLNLDSLTFALSSPFVENKTKVYRYEKAPAGLKNDKSHILIWNGKNFENAPH